MMFDLFEQYLSNRISLTREEFALIKSLSTEKKIAKREFILREGEVCGNATFVASGLLRLFRVDDKGNEHILRFAIENGWMSDRESYLTETPSHTNIDAIEDSGIVTWKKADFRFLLAEIPALKGFMKSLVAKNNIANQNRLYASISHSAEEKYFQFIAQHPAVFNRVPLHMVASYLGVTRETLSRIRRQSVQK